MSLFYNILDQHRNALIEKGYDEKSLNCPNQEGLLLEQLRVNFSNAMNESFRFKEKVEFELHTTAFFNSGEMVEIYLQYSFDEENDLQLTKVKYSDGNMEKEVPIKAMGELPFSKEIPALLKQKHKVESKIIPVLQNKRPHRRM